MVRRSSSGTCPCRSASTSSGSPFPDKGDAAHVRFVRTHLRLAKSGGFGDFEVTLPTGFGWRSDRSSRLLSRPKLKFAQLQFDQALLPAGNPRLNQTLFACEESKPFWIEASAMEWVVGEGRFSLQPLALHYVRAAELDALESAPVPAAMKIKRSNEQYFRFLDAALLSRGDCGRRRKGSCAHEPRGQSLRRDVHRTFPLWHDDRLGWRWALGHRRRSYRTCVEFVERGQARDGDICPQVFDTGLRGGDRSRRLDTLALDPPVLSLTPDGGLRGSGTLPAPQAMQWGYFVHNGVPHYAQEVLGLTGANFLMAGAFVRGDQAPPVPERAAIAILFTGVVPGTAPTLESPDTHRRAVSQREWRLRGHQFPGRSGCRAPGPKYARGLPGRTVSIESPIKILCSPIGSQRI